MVKYGRNGLEIDGRGLAHRHGVLLRWSGERGRIGGERFRGLHADRLDGGEDAGHAGVAIAGFGGEHPGAEGGDGR